ncbi:MAG: signal recognition particle-docking protein FtsY [Candidatus Muiribacteriota bacterium]
MAKIWNIFKKKEEEKLKQTEKEVKDSEKEVQNPVESQENSSMGWFHKLKKRLSKTRENFTYNIRKILNFSNLDEEAFEELEELFIKSDLGYELSLEFIQKIERKATLGEVKNSDDVISMLKNEFLEVFNKVKNTEEEVYPKILLVVGVNGVGKTTTIGKIAYNAEKNNKNTLLVAGDTFRAAAIEQLEIWSQRSKSSIIKHKEGSDSASVVYDGVVSGLSNKKDLIIVDTAGRLHNKENLMKELQKIKKVIKKTAGKIPTEVLLVIDATGGQNSLIQARVFSQAADVDGIVLTKMDGTARGGIILPIVKELKVPVKYIGIGEGIDDLKEFKAEEFTSALLD